jgi:hypothetical protein
MSYEINLWHDSTFPCCFAFKLIVSFRCVRNHHKEKLNKPLWLSLKGKS